MTHCWLRLHSHTSILRETHTRDLYYWKRYRCSTCGHIWSRFVPRKVTPQTSA